MHDSYTPIQDSDPPKSNWLSRILVTFILVGAAVVVTYFLTKNHFDKTSSSHSSYDPSKPYAQPKVFEAQLEFHIPYLEFAGGKTFTEPLFVHADMKKNKMRMTFFSGMDTYIYDYNKLKKHSIVPVQENLACLIANTSATPQVIFPDTSLFTKQDKQETISTSKYTNVLCDVWKLDIHDKKTKYNFTYDLPNDSGYVGTYYFYVNSADGTPVRFQSKYGHGIAPSGSHTDEYVMDYLNIIEMDSIDDFWFQPPMGMPCENGISPYGPTVHKSGVKIHRSDPTEDIQMMFPEGFELREEKFDDFRKKHGKDYSSPREHHNRKNLYHQRLKYINSHNRQGKSYSLGVNHMTDWTPEELKRLSGYRPNLQAVGNDKDICSLHPKIKRPVNESIDWTAKGWVNKPKDQGNCGSCWTYGVTGAIEGAVFNKTQKLVKLSEQNVMDCTWHYNNNACDGGDAPGAFTWMIKENRGEVALAESYAVNGLEYLNQDGFCHFSYSDNAIKNPTTGENVVSGATITGCVHVTEQYKNMSHKIVPDDEATALLTDAINYVGPISVAIAVPMDFYYYTSGLYYSEDCLNLPDDLDHIVLAVGYKVVNGERYTYIRNSWSDHWGEDGYVWISQKNNNCGVATTPTYALMD